MKRRDLWLLAGVLVIAAAVFLLAKLLPGEGGGLSGLQLPVVTAQPSSGDSDTTASASPATAPPDGTVTAAPAPTLVPAQAYLGVQMDNLVFDPFPLTESRDIELPQPEGKLNVVRVTQTSIVMHSSTCDNQDCVNQGEVTIENRGARVLGNQIICLPNKVILTLMTPEEAQQAWDTYNRQ